MRGMSLYWSQWDSGAKFYNADAVGWLVQDWGAQIVRAAMGVEDRGYLANPELEASRVEFVVSAAISLGIYVIVDWHAHRAEEHTDEAAAFFEAMAGKYRDVPNVLFETYNEPELEQNWSTVLKPYHERLVKAIRAQNNDNLIIMGSRCWCKCVDEAAEDPVPGDNLAYTLHFYAGNEFDGESVRTRARAAMERGVALFATEWGVCHPVEQDRKDFQESQVWLNFFSEHGISDLNWAISDKAEGCAALLPGASPTGHWGASQLSESGAYIRKTLRAIAKVAQGCERLCGLESIGALSCSARLNQTSCEASYRTTRQGDSVACAWASVKCEASDFSQACSDLPSICDVPPVSFVARAAPHDGASSLPDGTASSQHTGSRSFRGSRLWTQHALLQRRAWVERPSAAAGEL